MQGTNRPRCGEGGGGDPAISMYPGTRYVTPVLGLLRVYVMASTLLLLLVVQRKWMALACFSAGVRD